MRGTRTFIAALGLLTGSAAFAGTDNDTLDITLSADATISAGTTVSLSMLGATGEMDTGSSSISYTSISAAPQQIDVSVPVGDIPNGTQLMVTYGLPTGTTGSCGAEQPSITIGPADTTSYTGITGIQNGDNCSSTVSYQFSITDIGDVPADKIDTPFQITVAHTLSE